MSRATLRVTAAALMVLAATTVSVDAQREAPRGARQALREAGRYRETMPPDTWLTGRNGELVPSRRCGTHGLTAAEHADGDRRVAALAGSPRFDARAKTRVPVWFHVIHRGAEGRLEQTDIDAQILVLTRAFRKHGLKFRLAGVTYTDKNKWFKKCHQPITHRKMTSALAVDPARNLNIYSCNLGGGSLLGFAFLPTGSVAGTAQDSVVILHSTLPNGSAAPYDEGDTATHEVGHWAGLYHTFDPEPDGCQTPGDRVDDTPFERLPDYSCTPARDTCPQPGLDPITNFMDYVPDACMVKFTRGQGKRMRQQIGAFRPDL